MSFQLPSYALRERHSQWGELLKLVTANLVIGTFYFAIPLCSTETR